MQMYIGRIKEIDKNKLYLIKFIIPDIYEDETHPLTAVPLARLSRNPIVNDEIVIIKPERELDLFYYILSHEDPDLISLQFNDKNFIKINKESDKININIKCDNDININSNSNININSNSNININSGSSGNVLINNHLKVTK